MLKTNPESAWNIQFRCINADKHINRGHTADGNHHGEVGSNLTDSRREVATISHLFQRDSKEKCPGS